jgi:hypothetical protein
MMKKRKKLLLATACALTISGCAQSNQPAQPSDSPPAATQPTAPSAETGTTPAAAEQTSNAANPQAQPQQMDEQAAVKLFAEGMKRYWHVMSGGASDGGPILSFPINGVDYRYLGKDIDTKEKLMEYLQAVYTQEASEELIKKARIVEHQGRMAQPNGDYGSLMQPEKAQASLVKETADTKQYELKVPLGDDASIPPEIVLVEVKKTGESWKLNTPANQMK